MNPDKSFLDLDAESRRALEFDELLEWVASYARSRLGADRIRSLRPSADLAVVRRELAAVDEAVRYLVERGKLLPGSLPDPSPAIQGLEVAEMRLEPQVLRDLAWVGSAAYSLRSQLLELGVEDFPLLRGHGEALPDLERESRAVLDGTDAEGRILDEASEELRAIRASRSRVGRRLRGLLQRLLRDPAAESVIRDDFITERNGRFVIPIRTDAPRPVEGIVHASSSSGATHFVEPLESVELNNELVRLAEEEREEQDRVLSFWSDAFRKRRPEIVSLMREMGRVDDLQARALFAAETEARTPRVVESGPLKFTEVRHPLLDRRMRGEGGRAVPLSLKLDPAHQVLVLSGPNTGGKTVALKTLGLAVLTAQSGIPVAAQDLELPVYRQVRADIGDHQSIQADLSTYSAHIQSVVEFLDRPLPPALFLFNEIGTGTEPSEGAALAQSILESLLASAITAVATTHLGALKVWAVTTEGAACAAMEFDTVALRPTFRIMMGAAGTSAGLEIAERLGLSPVIVGNARARLAPEAQRGEDYLRRLRELLAEAEARGRSLARERAELEQARREHERRATEGERKRRERSTRALEQALADFRKQAGKELAGIRDKRDRARLERATAKSGERLRGEQLRLEAKLAPPDRRHDAWVAPATLSPGMQVFVRNLGRQGEVVGGRGSRVEVRLGDAVFEVADSELRVPAGAPVERPTRREEPARRRPAGRAPEDRREAAPAAFGGRFELQLVGKRVEEALAELDKFLDASILAGRSQVRVIHGHGTGRLRSAVRRHLDSSAHVSGSRPGRTEEGGDGVTIVTLS